MFRLQRTAETNAFKSNHSRDDDFQSILNFRMNARFRIATVSECVLSIERKCADVVVLTTPNGIRSIEWVSHKNVISTTNLIVWLCLRFFPFLFFSIVSSIHIGSKHLLCSWESNRRHKKWKNQISLNTELAALSWRDSCHAVCHCQRKYD